MSRHIVKVIFGGDMIPTMNKNNKFMVEQRRKNNLNSLWMVLTLLYMINEAKYSNEQDKEIAKLKEEIDQLKGERIMR